MAAIKYTLFYLVVLFLALSCLFAYSPLIIPFIFLLTSILTFIFYARDKRAAIHNEWRISENTLQIFALIGGWPGAIIAQQTLRHKNRKKKFQIIFWLVMVINTGSLIWLHTSKGSTILKAFITSLEELIYSEFDSNKITNALLYLLQYATVV